MKLSPRFLLAATGLLTGCSMAPTYQRPALPVPDSYPAHQAVAAGSAPTPPDWQVFFHDPVLHSLIRLALDNNRQLRVAAANMAEARADYGMQRASLFPEIDLGGYAGRQRIPAMTQEPTGQLGPIRNGSDQPITFDTDQVQAGFTSYELDFFGHQRAATDEAHEQAGASTADYQAARIALIGEVANAYLALNADRALLQLTDTTLQQQQQHAKVIDKAFADGGVAEIDMHRARTQVDIAKVDRQDAIMRIAQDIDALAVLVGQPMPTGYAAPRPWQAPLLTDVPAGLPSSLLERRPDIVAAEDRLRASNADIGRARAAFFPKIALTAVLGTLSSGLSGLFGAGSAAWNANAAASMPLLDWGRHKNDLSASKARNAGATAAYEGAVQQAFREVADALAIRDHIVPQLKSQQDLVGEQQRVYDIAQVRFRNGASSYLDSQDAQRTLYQAQAKLIQIQLMQAVNQVDLYKALGGGWSPASVARTAQQGRPTASRPGALGGWRHLR